MCDECFINEEKLAGSLNTYGSYVVSAGTNMHYIQEYLNRALGHCPDMKIMIEGLKQAYKIESILKKKKRIVSILKQMVYFLGL